MGDQIPAEEQSNYETFRECVAEPVLRALATPAEAPKARKKRRAKKILKEKNTVGGISGEEAVSKADGHAQEPGSNDADDLAEFIDYIATIIFPSLPAPLRTITHSTYKSSPSLQEAYTPPLLPSTYTPLLSTISPIALDTLTSAGLLPPFPDVPSQRNFLLPILIAYITSTTAPPPAWSTTRPSSCELCARSWIPLTYHHLIPRSTHTRVLKRGWHAEEDLNRVAWLCRACHSFVHGLAGNEELAKGFYTVELIREGGKDRDVEIVGRVEGWIRWVGGVRWKSR